MGFRKANDKDLPAIMTIIQEAKESLRIAGVDQWQAGYPNEESIRGDIERGESWIFEENGEGVGTAMVSFAGEKSYDVIYDGEWLTLEKNYGVIHRIAVKNQWRQKGIAGKMLAEVERMCRERGVYDLRIDTHQDNVPMNTWLIKNRFFQCGTIVLSYSGEKRIAYEKELLKESDYQNFLQILKEELVPAMGCTEPIAIAYGAARARKILGKMPDKVLVEASGNIIKNVKSVVVPNTGGLKGIEAAAAAGIVAGNDELALEVISVVGENGRQEIRKFLDTVPIRVVPAEIGEIFDIWIHLTAGEDRVTLRIAKFHTNIVLIEKNGETLFRSGETGGESAGDTSDRGALSVRKILEFVETVDVEQLIPTVKRQIDTNLAIARTGIDKPYGANIGKVILKYDGQDVRCRAKAMAAAGSDARMSGCEMPVIIVSGSGNQGMTASLPVIVYAMELKVPEETMIRAVALSDLITVHLKTGIGRLSAYCGAVSAGCSSGAAIAWLHGEGYRGIAHTLVNSLAVVSGIVCDGAKPSCAAKIAAAVDAGILGYHMFLEGQQFRGGEGIVRKGVEATIENISRLGSEGMRETDKEIIRIMTCL